MATWRAIADSDITAKLSADELESIRASAPEGTDPVAEAVAQVVDRVRGYVAAWPRNVMGPAGTVPARLMDAACALLVPALYGRTAGLMIDLNDVRKEAAKSAEALLRDILDELHDLGQSANLQSRVEAILSRMACHGSIRSGRRMQADEMNALLREMEATPHSGQCNHGRPTYVALKLSDIERLFGRT